MKTALITGVCGQDGSYLAELLLARGYRVLGTSRSGHLSAPLRDRVEHVAWDPSNLGFLCDVLAGHAPDEIYNLAAMSSGSGMSDDPVGIGEVNGLAVARLLEAIRKAAPGARFCQASSSEMFGLADHSPQSEATAFRPRNAYGAAKLFAHVMVGHYRSAHGIFAASAILYNHESPRRGMGFVSRKITHGAASIKRGQGGELRLGNLEARRDWGSAQDHVRGMVMMLGHDRADDFVLATGRLRTVREFCEAAFACVGLDYRDHVREDAALFRPDEAVPLAGDAGKARSQLGWAPQIEFADMVAAMVDSDMKQLSGAAP